MFFAPEMFISKIKGIKVRGKMTDLWALGITLFYMMCGQYPFEKAKNQIHLKDLIVDGEIPFDFIKNA